MRATFHSPFLPAGGVVAVLLLATGPAPVRAAAARPDFGLVGFAAIEAHGIKGTTGGRGGELRQVRTLVELVAALKDDAPRMVELMNDVDLSALNNAAAGSPPEYPTGRIFVGSNKTLFSRGEGATLRRGMMEIRRKQNIILRNLKFRDLWVDDPSGRYDKWGWDYVVIDESHHVWVDHCDFERVYDGMVDIKKGADFITLSWNVFRDQKKCLLVGHSDSATAAALDRGRLNVTLHHNWFDRVDERTPRMRFGNAHVFNNYFTGLGGKGIQSTSGAVVLVEHCVFGRPGPDARPTVEENGGPPGTVKVVNSRILNAPGATTVFRERGAENFSFNPPFAGARPPYHYAPDPVEMVAGLVTNFAGAGKLEFPAEPR
jgi:pectate lyase